MTTWFRDIGWWRQEEAYRIFNIYRQDRTEKNLNAAIEAALPVIRVVYATQHLNLDSSYDLDDLVSAAALTLCKAMPKIALKSTEQIGSHQQYMRYLFTCVLNAFFKELNIIQNKPNRIKRKAATEHPHTTTPDRTASVNNVELKLFLQTIPGTLLELASTKIRFTDHRILICKYILKQLIEGREVSRALLQTMGCHNRDFFVEYCNFILMEAFKELKQDVNQSGYTDPPVLELGVCIEA